jgi:regulator of extracellular matrix RemA (YlzA/DUF370 family)
VGIVMAKRNVAYIKPEEPAFLKRMKQQAGYQEPEEILDAKVSEFSKKVLPLMFSHKINTYLVY